MKYSAERSATLLVALLVLIWPGSAGAQEGAKSTDPAGGYEVSSATVVSSRPRESSNLGGRLPEANKAQNKAQSATRKARGPNPVNQVTPNRYQVDRNFKQGPPARGEEHAVIGVTIWRMGPEQCPIQNCPLPADNSKGLFDTASRVEDNLPLSTGERVRLALESLSHKGFVYIINREQFADGTRGAPYLIFPTQGINNGKNWILPGQQIQLPRAEGCFCVKARDPRQVLVADELIVIVSPTALLEPNEIGAREVAMPAKLSEFLGRAQSQKTSRGTLKGGAGLVQTAQEQTAGSKGLVDTEPVLTQSDLPPQNVYQSLIPTGAAAVFTFSLRYN